MTNKTNKIVYILSTRKPKAEPREYIVKKAQPHSSEWVVVGKGNTYEEARGIVAFDKGMIQNDL